MTCVYHFKFYFQTWLNDLALEMKQTLKQLLVECVTAGQSSQGAIDPSLFPSQVRGFCLDGREARPLGTPPDAEARPVGPQASLCPAVTLTGCFASESSFL